MWVRVPTTGGQAGLLPLGQLKVGPGWGWADVCGPYGEAVPELPSAGIPGVDGDVRAAVDGYHRQTTAGPGVDVAAEQGPILLYLQVVHGLTGTQIAQVTGLSELTVSRRLAAARQAVEVPYVERDDGPLHPILCGRAPESRWRWARGDQAPKVCVRCHGLDVMPRDALLWRPMDWDLTRRADGRPLYRPPGQMPGWDRDAYRLVAELEDGLEVCWRGRPAAPPEAREQARAELAYAVAAPDGPPLREDAAGPALTAWAASLPDGLWRRDTPAHPRSGPPVIAASVGQTLAWIARATGDVSLTCRLTAAAARAALAGLT